MAICINSTLLKVSNIVTRVFKEVNAVIITVFCSPNSAAWTAGDVTTRWRTVLHRNCSGVKLILYFLTPERIYFLKYSTYIYCDMSVIFLPVDAILWIIYTRPTRG